MPRKGYARGVTIESLMCAAIPGFDHNDALLYRGYAIEVRVPECTSSVRTSVLSSKKPCNVKDYVNSDIHTMGLVQFRDLNSRPLLSMSLLP